MEFKTIKEVIVKSPASGIVQEIIFLTGLPGSGKSTYAQYLIDDAEDQNEMLGYVCTECSGEEEETHIGRVNKDEIREMLRVTGYTPDREKVVLSMERAAGLAILDKGWDLIVDSTNLAKKHLNFWKQEAEARKIQMTKVHMDVAVDECIARDAGRVKPVGKDVILSMHQQLTGGGRGKVDPRIENLYEPDVYLPGAVICDLDGTAALMNGRSPFAEDVSSDIPNYPVLDLLKIHEEAGIEIIFFSGRAGTQKCIESTSKWLDDKTKIKSRNLYFRAEGDSRKDSIIKKELYEKVIKDKYSVLFVLDDRDQVVDLWRKELNLPCFQVYYGDF